MTSNEKIGLLIQPPCSILPGSFNRLNDNDKFTIWSVNRDGSGAEKLMEDSVSLISPAW
jgi:hypothetical protein